MTTQAEALAAQECARAWMAAQPPPPPAPGFAYPPAVDCLAGTVPSIPGFPAGQPSSYWQGRQQIITRQQGCIASGSIALIGDSIMDGLAPGAVSLGAVNFGIASDTVIGVLNRLGATSSLHQAGAVVLLIGINDLLDKYRSYDVNAPLAAILRWLTGPLVFLKLWRVDPALAIPEADAWRRPSFNAGVDYVNEQAAAVLAGRAHTAIIDTNALLSDPGASGFIKPAYHLGDAVHPNTAGYGLLAGAIRDGLAAVLE